MVLKLGGQRKKHTWGKLMQNGNIPSVAVRYLIRLWSMLPSLESSSKSSHRKFVRTERITIETLKGIDNIMNVRSKNFFSQIVGTTDLNIRLKLLTLEGLNIGIMSNLKGVIISQNKRKIPNSV